MITKAVSAIATAKTGMWHFALLVLGGFFVVGLIKWANDNPAQWKALASQAGEAGMQIATKLLEIAAGLATWFADFVAENLPAD